MQTGPSQVLLHVKEPSPHLLDFLKGLGYVVKHTEDPARDILFTTVPTFFITDSSDVPLKTWCKFLLQARKNAVLEWPCSEQELRTAADALHAKDVDCLVARVNSPSFEIPEHVFSGKIDVSEIVTAAQLDRVRNEPNLATVKFNVWDFTLDELLVVATTLYDKGLKMVGLSVPFERLLYTCAVFRSVYGFRGYHSFRHIVDVMQYTYFLGCRSVYPNTATPLSEYHRGILIVAALGHDVLHPGFSTATVKACNPAWGSQYPTLEDFHSKVYKKLLGVLLPELDQIGGAWTDVTELILATDMAMHRGLMKIDLTDKDKGDMTFLCFLLKLSDIGNASRVFAASVRQSMCITVEIRNEHDIRTPRGLPMLPHIKVFAGEPVPKSLEEAWERMQRNQKGFVMNFLVPTLGKLRDSQAAAAENVCTEITAQVEQTVCDFQKHAYPPGQEDLLHYLF